MCKGARAGLGVVSSSRMCPYCCPAFFSGVNRYRLQGARKDTWGLRPQGTDHRSSAAKPATCSGARTLVTITPGLLHRVFSLYPLLKCVALGYHCARTARRTGIGVTRAGELPLLANVPRAYCKPQEHGMCKHPNILSKISEPSIPCMCTLCGLQSLQGSVETALLPKRDQYGR